MLFQRLNQSDPERLFIVAKNTEGSALAADDACIWATHSASIDGVAIRQGDTGHAGSVVGIVDAAISDGDYGLVQVYGYRSTSRVFQTNTSQDTGVMLEASLGAAHLSSYATSTSSNANVTLHYPFFVLGETIASSSASATISAKLFVRCM